MILVVEDNSELRELASSVLKFAGFTVLLAVDARSALELFEENPEINLVFSDVIMPGGVTGVELAKQILERKPDTRILLASGYEEKADSIRESAKLSANITCISKPYELRKLPELVQSILDGKTPD